MGKLRDKIQGSWQDGVFVSDDRWLDCPRSPANILVDDIEYMIIKHDVDMLGHLYTVESFEEEAFCRETRGIGAW